MILARTSIEAAGFRDRFATALYMGGAGYPPRSGLVQRQYYAGQILDGGRFHVLAPDRMCFTVEFLSFQLVSKPWSELSEIERSLLFAVYSQKKLALESLSAEIPAPTWNGVACRLSRAGYLRWTDEIQVVELTPVGEAEIQDRIFSPSIGDNLVSTQGGIRIQHHGVQDHEIDLGRASTLSINVDGMLIRIFTLPVSGAVVRIDYDRAHGVHMSSQDETRNFAQVYIDHAAPILNLPAVPTVKSSVKRNTICLTGLDLQRLKNLLDNPVIMQHKPNLQELEHEIEQAAVVQSTEVPADTMTMNSTARLIDLKSGEEMLFTLVYPDHANTAEGRISVFAPIGTALLGCRQGETIEWKAPAGIRSLRVDRILYQPEAAGDYSL